MVGTALDTNGQKRRYVEAAKRWGDDPDVLKALVVGDKDLAGVGARWAAAARKSRTLSIRSAHKARYAFFDYPVDVVWDRSTQREVQEMADDADLIHLTNDVRAYTQLKQHRHRKPALLHHHGTLLRNHPQTVLPNARRFNMVQAVSTVDLLRMADDLHWLPTAYDLEELAAIRDLNRRPDDGMVRIVSAPTNREIKSTALLEQAVVALQSEGLSVELVLVEGRSWVECLAVKATADIYFDQVKLGYGCNAIEAWGMGIPVVAGADEWTLTRMRSEWNLGLSDPLPFYAATETTIADALRELVQSADLRAEAAARGKAHAEKYHAERPALVRLAELYSMAVAKQQAAPSSEPYDEFALAPGTFMAPKARIVRMLNQQYRFKPEHPVVIEDPRLAQRMRRLAANNRRYQIEEVA